ncbi:MAG TPA: hypothetical protein VFT43_07310 [Candidatus Polarisedimenticolia bacterium]|nr:hypothetical protein [Candidatus Polarisedimenticolia bacterium]
MIYVNGLLYVRWWWLLAEPAAFVAVCLLGLWLILLADRAQARRESERAFRHKYQLPPWEEEDEV